MAAPLLILSMVIRPADALTWTTAAAVAVMIVWLRDWPLVVAMVVALVWVALTVQVPDWKALIAP